jgi:hypothetical protein
MQLSIDLIWFLSRYSMQKKLIRHNAVGIIIHYFHKNIWYQSHSGNEMQLIQKLLMIRILTFEMREKFYFWTWRNQCQANFVAILSHFCIPWSEKISFGNVKKHWQTIHLAILRNLWSETPITTTKIFANVMNPLSSMRMRPFWGTGHEVNGHFFGEREETTVKQLMWDSF